MENRVSDPAQLPTYAAATLPAAGQAGPGAIVLVSDGSEWAAVNAASGLSRYDNITLIHEMIRRGFACQKLPEENT